MVPFAFGETAQDERIGILDLVFDPVRGTARLVEALRSFGHDSLDTLGFGGFEKLGAVSFEMIGIADHVGGIQDLLKKPLPFYEGDAAQVIIVQIDQVEREEDHWNV